MTIGLRWIARGFYTEPESCSYSHRYIHGHIFLESCILLFFSDILYALRKKSILVYVSYTHGYYLATMNRVFLKLLISCDVFDLNNELFCFYS